MWWAEEKVGVGDGEVDRRELRVDESLQDGIGRRRDRSLLLLGWRVGVGVGLAWSMGM